MSAFHERLAVLETKMIHLDKCMDETKDAVHSLQRAVWQASGAVGVFVGVVELLLKFIGH